MNHVLVRRAGVLAASAVVALGGLTGLSAGAAQAAPSPSAALGADWLDGDLPATDLYTNPYGPTPPTDDVGLTLDAGFAAVAAGDDALVQRVQQGVAPEIAGFAAGTPSSTAKALAFATRSGADPRSFGGVDLVALMESQVDGAGRLTGDGGFAVYGQAYAVEGLAAAGSTETAAALSYLQGLQCASGAFGADLPDAGQSPACTLASDATPGPDEASLVSASLARVSPTAAVNSTLDRAAAFLVSIGDAGGYNPGYGDPINANSTALAAAALGASCRVLAADASADLVRALQVPAGTTGALADEVGSVAPDATALDSARTNGLGDDFVRDSFRRATTQAVTGLVWDTSAAASLTITGPATAAPGSAQTLSISGARKGETVCLTTPAGVQRLVGTGAPLNVPVVAPATGSAAYSATSGPGSATFSLTTAAATAPVAVPPTAPKAEVKTKKVSAGDKVKIQVRGLEPGTKVVTKLRGATVDKTRAKANGTAKVVFTLGAKQAKPGKATVKIKPAGEKPLKKKIRVTRR